MLASSTLLRHAVEVGARLAEADDAPAQVAEDLPEAHALGVDLRAARRLVRREELLALADAADGLRRRRSATSARR